MAQSPAPISASDGGDGAEASETWIGPIAIPDTPEGRSPAGAVLSLEPVTATNYHETLGLSVHPEQERFVSSNAVSIADCYIYPGTNPRLAREGSTPVGFTLVHLHAYGPDGTVRFFIERFMIDRAHQRRGLGQALLRLIADWAARFEPVPASIALGCVADNAAAKTLYRSVGFSETGDVRYGEDVMARPLHLPTESAR
ncbi:MAG: GNAT family N-acetyltransferase [Pseudomonadota bacterium]